MFSISFCGRCIKSFYLVSGLKYVSGAHPFDPFGNAPESKILTRVAKGKYDVSNKQFQQISSLAKDLIRHLLDPDPVSRYTADQALAHPWISDVQHLSSEPLPSSNIMKLKGFQAIRLLVR